jgi:serine/threonine protein kinase
VGVQNLSGQTLGQYELRELLGAGGMGAVYLAYQTPLERFVAVKVLNMALLSDPDYLTRFTREAKTSASLEHPHIVPVYDYATQNGISYVVMRYLTGGTLAERLNHSRETGRTLPSLTEVSSIIRQLADALHYAHGRGVIHRDVKANNVMFDDKGTAFLVDFGIAKLTSATSAITGTGTAIGTPSYMSPEQWRGDVVTPAADQYALGVLTYAMLTGRMPFEAETAFALMHKHLHEEPTPLSVFRDDLPESVRNVLQKVLAKKSEDRYPDVLQYWQELDRAVGQIQVEPTGFFITPLPKRVFLPPDQPTALERVREDDPLIGKEITSIPAVVVPEPVSVAEPPNRFSLMVGVGLLGTLIIAGVLFALFYAQQSAQLSAQTATSQQALAIVLGQTETIAAQPTATATASPLPSDTPTATQMDVRAAAVATRGAILTGTAAMWTPTFTPDTAQTFAAELTALFELDLTATADEWTPTSTDTPTLMPTSTPTPTATFNMREVARATRDMIATITATAWTATPTPDLTETLQAELTSLYERDLTLTATRWTKTPTTTSTATFTPTTVPPTHSPTPVRIRNCPDAPPSRLYAGLEGFVLPDDSRLVNVRRSPGTGAEDEIRDQMRIGETFTVIEGPECADGFAWYLVNYGGGGLEGWIAEGDDQNYFVAPIDQAQLSNQSMLQRDCTVLVEDDFEDGTSTNDWFTQSNERYVVGMSSGSYNLQVNFLRDRGAGDPQGESAPALWGSLRGVEFRNASIEAVITASIFNPNTEVRTGLWVRYQSDRDFLAFMIRGDGSYRITRYTGDRYEDVIPWTRTTAIVIGDGATNTMRIDMQRDQFDLYLNERYVDTIYDDTWRSGRVAFMGVSSQTPVTFALDYFRVCQR